MNNITHIGQLFNNLNQVIYTLRLELEGLKNEITTLKKEIDASKTSREIVPLISPSHIKELSDKVVVLDEQMVSLKESTTQSTEDLSKDLSNFKTMSMSSNDVQVMIDKSLSMLLADMSLHATTELNSNAFYVDIATPIVPIVESVHDVDVEVKDESEKGVSASTEDVPVVSTPQKVTKNKGRARGKKATS